MNFNFFIALNQTDPLENTQNCYRNQFVSGPYVTVNPLKEKNSSYLSFVFKGFKSVCNYLKNDFAFMVSLSLIATITTFIPLMKGLCIFGYVSEAGANIFIKVMFKIMIFIILQCPFYMLYTKLQSSKFDKAYAKLKQQKKTTNH